IKTSLLICVSSHKVSLCVSKLNAQNNQKGLIMSTTDDSFSVTHDPIDIQRTSIKERWWNIMDTWKVGIIPLPLFVLAGALIAIDCMGGKLPSDIVVMVATLAFFGFACGEFGKRLPIVGKLGAAAI